MGTRGFRGERKRYTRRGKEEARILDRRRHCTVELVQCSFPANGVWNSLDSWKEAS